MWNDEFELPDGSYSVLNIQDCTEDIKNTKHYTPILLFIFTSTALAIDKCSK